MTGREIDGGDLTYLKFLPLGKIPSEVFPLVCWGVVCANAGIDFSSPRAGVS